MPNKKVLGSVQDFAELYAEICDVVCRDDLQLPDNDLHRHTSDHARALAMKILERLIDRYEYVRFS